MRPFIRASVAMRCTHSVYAFLIVLLTNGALSASGEGAVAVFQYAKKLADGLASLSVGPHVSVYHAAQARAWAVSDPTAFRANVRAYLISAFPLLLAATLVFAAGAGAAVHFLHSAEHRLPPSGAVVLFLLLAWQMLLAFEAIPLGVLVIDKRTAIVLCVNATVVLVFFMVIHFVLVRPYSSIGVAATSLGSQAISTILFLLMAQRVVQQRFSHCDP